MHSCENSSLSAGGIDDVCVLRAARFRGAPCSDLVGAQRPIAELLPSECCVLIESCGE